MFKSPCIAQRDFLEKPINVCSAILASERDMMVTDRLGWRWV